MRNTLSPEAQLLLQAAGDADRAVAAPNDLDWTKMMALAQQEGATAVLWRWLHRRAGHGLTPDIALQWRKLAMVVEFRMLQLERALHAVIQLFEGHGIETMLLKGSALAYSAYGSFGDRPMSDLDLLVRPERAAEAWERLQADGWSWPAGQWPAEHYAAHQHLPPLISPSAGEGGVRLEIHTALLPGGHPFDWPVARVWQQARRLRVRGQTVLVPDPLHQLLHVCVHFAWSHEMRWGSWRALRDVDVLIRGDNFVWTRFVELARASRARSCCYWTLRLARSLTDAPVPNEALRALRPRRPEAVLRRLEQHYMLQLFSTEDGCPSEALRKALWEMGIAPRSSGHGKSRPWQVSGQWSGTVPKRGRLLGRTRHAAVAVRYLARLTASRLPRLA